ncbi:MAG: HEAT repeat domain-containing protein [Candidatus Oleimicrobiaceae bacterium]
MKTAALVLLSAMALTAVPIAATPEGDYERYLISSLTDGNRGVRTSAAQLLGEMQCKAAVPRLMWMVAHDHDYAARITAALALCRIGDPKALPLLRRRAKHDVNKTVRRVLSGVVQSMEATLLADHR